MSDVSRLFEAQQAQFAKWEIIKDVIDQQIDLMLNYRQSGHPGGSRSKVHYFVSLLLSGAMRWDIRHPEKRFGDRFILVAGHTAPLVYATLAVFNEALRVMHEKTGDKKYLVHGGSDRMLTWEDLLDFRNVGGLPGHVEMAEKNLFCKFNTGPSGHGAPVCAGEAMALKRAGASGVKVFGIEGEGGHTAGCWHETKNTAYGLGLDNLHMILDWNDFGIDPHSYSSIVHGSPRDWFASYGWDIHEAENGSDWTQVTHGLLEMTKGQGTPLRPSMLFGKTTKGRGYHKIDAASHGSPHALNSDLFWQCRADFSEIYGVEWKGTGQPAPADAAEKRQQFADNLNVALEVLRNNEELVTYLADRLVEIGDSVPEEIDGFQLPVSKNPLKDTSLFDVESYPADMWAQPGDKQPNRAGFAKWGSYINSYCLKKFGRPLFLVCSADLAGSTNISGFGDGYGDMKNNGWYNRETNPDGIILPQAITEFANAGLMVGLSSVNMSTDPENEFNGFYTACSTYGSFSYLKYGAMRLYSQLAQDCELAVGKVIWVAGHSGPETAEDSRTHFGIFSPASTQMFPDGHVINIHPWEYNEVPVLLAAAMKTDKPIVALHLTRPGVKIPDRKALGLASHFEAAKGAYILRDYKAGQPRQGTIMVQGTMSTYNLINALPAIDQAGVNVKIVAVPSPQLFALQSPEYQDQVLTQGDKLNSTYVTNRARRTMVDWNFNPLADRYAMSSDWDDMWRPGGSLDEVCESAGLDPESLAKGVIAFAEDHDKRMAELESMLGAAKE
nr:transketolase [Candidatus Krumholzibacteria bacterium]